MQTIKPPLERTAESFVLPGKIGARRNTPLYFFAILAVVVCVGMVYEQIKRRAVGAVYDSEEFRRALATWNPLIQHNNTSPRALKRFMNKLRFLAMRQRALAASGHAESTPRTIREPALVTMSALENYDPYLLDTLHETGDLSVTIERAGLGSVGHDALLLGTGEDAGNWPELVERYRSIGTVVRIDLDDVEEPPPTSADGYSRGEVTGTGQAAE